MEGKLRNQKERDDSYSSHINDPAKFPDTNKMNNAEMIPKT
jgi:hypothetical protein